MEEYIRTLLEQIRCRRMHPSIAQELRSHIEDQAEANRAAGMDAAQALDAAIQDMGDPVEAGISLDRIHRPQIAWSMVVVMAVISLLNLIIHVLIGLHFDTVNGYDSYSYISRSITHVVLGFAAMLLLYRLDYTFLVRYARALAALFYCFLYAQVCFLGVRMAGAVSFARIGPVQFSLIHLSFLSVPLYGALLYQYRGTGYRGILRAIVWILLPSWICFHIPCLSHTILLFFMMSLLLSLAVWKGWFRIAKKRFLAAYWGAVLLLPLAWIFGGIVLNLFAVYQIARIRAFLDKSAGNYIGNLLSSYLESARLFGNSGKEIAGWLPDYNSSYIVTFVSSYYGLAAAILVCLLVLFVGYKILRISLRQKNQAGMMVGCSCGLVLLLSAVINILENWGLLPVTQTFMPFFSHGGTAQIISYSLAGIALSVYRYQNMIPKRSMPESV